MKVLQLGPYPPPWGGVQANLVSIREYLLRRGHGCAVVNVTRHRKPEADEVYYPETPAQLLRHLRRLRYDIIHLHVGGGLPARLLGLALACATVGRGKSVLTFHSGGYPSSPEGRTARPATLRGFVFRRFDRVIAVNEEIAGMFRRFGVAPARVRLILPHALSAAPTGVELGEPLRGFFGAHEKVLLTVGLLEPEYDLAAQIDALGAVRERFPGAGLVIIGSGSLEGELRRLIAEKPYAGHVLLCGDVPHEATLRAVSESDLFLRTTLYDGDAISVREALHLGVPVVATDNGMRPGGVALVPVADGRALVAAIDAHLSRERAPRGAGDAATDERNVEEVFKLYEELLGS
ncbi:MAG: glycosyltransferase family 4 protein [Acidobacteria bacterium]|nr:glycosyltransferase family 4 protein [Acidobacteriota bacterium]MCA1641382.1 glycosyltransferase family 4 protein [Acidobacteriota bacterium]